MKYGTCEVESWSRFPPLFSILSFHKFSLLLLCRSDAQRAAKQKEAKERELEHQVFSADRLDQEGGFPMSMVSQLYNR